MKMTKHERQEKILKLIKTKEISTQEDLVSALNKDGQQITQATVSRDIKDLGIIKVASTNGVFKYTVLDRTGDVAPGRLLNVFSQSVLYFQPAANMLILKTLPGMAQAAASAMDSLHLNNVIGTIAGDDTVFIATPSGEEALALAETVQEMGIASAQPSNLKW